MTIPEDPAPAGSFFVPLKASENNAVFEYCKITLYVEGGVGVVCASINVSKLTVKRNNTHEGG